MHTRTTTELWRRMSACHRHSPSVGDPEEKIVAWVGCLGTSVRTDTTYAGASKLRVYVVGEVFTFHAIDGRITSRK